MFICGRGRTLPMEVTPIKILQKYWNYDKFRPNQEEIIDNILKNLDTIGILPTGGGKSICYQVPTLCLPGLAVVISPLISLIQDQTQGLIKRDISCINLSGNLKIKELDFMLDRAVYDKQVKFLFLSPERLQNDLVRARIGKMPVNLLVIDEAHCISQWGHDFRPSYLNIHEIKEHLPKNTPTLALTATANERVQKDISEHLQLAKDSLTIKGSFLKPGLSIYAIETNDYFRYIKGVLKKNSGSGIIYVRNRKETKEIAQLLNGSGESCGYYHAGMASEERSRIQNAWLSGKLRVIVATNAFGMGIDKPDVRFVIHKGLAPTLEDYYQEIGRAGRDRQPAVAVSIYGQDDITRLKENLQNSFPDLSEIRKVYLCLGNFFQLAYGSGEETVHNFDLSEFCNRFNLPTFTTHAALKLLEKAEYISLSEATFSPSRVHVTANNLALYETQVVNNELRDIIQVLLRTYTGIFDSYVKINESQLAKTLKTTPHKVMSLLERLAQLKQIDYSKQSNTPKIQFLQARIPEKQLSLPSTIYTERKKVLEEMQSAFLNFIQNKSVCRQIQLCAYFGETVHSPCGICDTCKQNEKQELSPEQLQEVQAYLKAKQKTNVVDYEMHALTHIAKETRLQYLRQLIDENVVTLQENQIIYQSSVS